MPPNPANPCSPSRPKPGPKRGSTWIDPPHSRRLVNLNPPSTASKLALDSQDEEDPTDPTRDDRRRLKRLICLCPCPGQQQQQQQRHDISEPGQVLTRRIYLCDGAVGMLEDGLAEVALDRAHNWRYEGGQTCCCQVSQDARQPRVHAGSNTGRMTWLKRANTTERQVVDEV